MSNNWKWKCFRHLNFKKTVCVSAHLCVRSFFIQTKEQHFCTESIKSKSCCVQHIHTAFCVVTAITAGTEARSGEQQFHISPWQMTAEHSEASLKVRHVIFFKCQKLVLHLLMHPCCAIRCDLLCIKKKPEWLKHGIIFLRDITTVMCKDWHSPCVHTPSLCTSPTSMSSLIVLWGEGAMLQMPI
jgi:hypothetical protein